MSEIIFVLLQIANLLREVVNKYMIVPSYIAISCCRYQGLSVRKVPAINTSPDTVLAAAQLPNCYLCNDDKDYISEKRLAAHITRCHLKPVLQLENLHILLCKRYCDDKHGDKGHYHCLFCPFTGRQRERVKIHINRHVRTIKKRVDTAENHLPECMDDHTVPDEWIHEEAKEDVRTWEKSFNDYIVNVYAQKAKTNNNVLTERKKWLIYNHVKLGMDIEDKSLKYWVRFRGIKVISCSQLGLNNVMVLPLTKYNNDTENRAINVQPEPLSDGYDIVLTSDNPEHEFFLCYRLIPTREELFKLLYQMHVINTNHPTPKAMFGEIRRKYLHFPRALVDKFVGLCPSCCVHFPDSNGPRAPVITINNADSIYLAALQVTVVDMTEHPDGRYRYVVECFDRSSRLTWLFPAERAVATDLAEVVIRSVLSVTGLPTFIVTNCGNDFLEKMLAEIERRWYGSCTELINRSREASVRLSVFGSDDLMDALQKLVMQQPTSWASAIPHLQFRMNHTRGGGGGVRGGGSGTQEQSAFEIVFGRQRSRPTWQKFLSNTCSGNNNTDHHNPSMISSGNDDTIQDATEDSEDEDDL